MADRWKEELPDDMREWVSGALEVAREKAASSRFDPIRARWDNARGENLRDKVSAASEALRGAALAHATLQCVLGLPWCAGAIFVPHAVAQSLYERLAPTAPEKAGASVHLERDVPVEGWDTVVLLVRKMEGFLT